uniref:Kunitz/Bovine pancreatic trypsin inhibitor domain protein n=1 Tax=Caenorhabditis tropicalis TaxID=1561998 RepID=A0A1I7T9J9_9PELO
MSRKRSKTKLEDKIEHEILNNLKKEEEKEEVVLSTPSTCELEYDSDLRNECTSADWTELFYWNEQFKECEAFWYDSSCGEPDFDRKNLFKNYDDCNNKCVKKIGQSDRKTIPFTKPSTTTSTSTTTTTTTTTEKPATPSEMLLETKRPDYKQDDPLNLILNKALKPDESSELPEKFPPNHEKTFVNFALKSEITATTKFDRLKYMAEFRKKLLALPDNYSTKGNPTAPTSSPVTEPRRDESTTLETSESETQRTTTPMIPTETTTTSFDDFVEAEKKRVLETIRILDRPDDLCDEPLHPKLEEDCKNDHWEIKWFFNSDRSACKSFWYGGCEVESRNFFPDHANCRHTCAHKYGTPASFSSKVYIPPGDLSTPIPPRKDRLTTSLKLTYPHSEDLFPNQNHVTVVELDGNFQRVAEQERLRLSPTRSYKPKESLPTAGNIVNVSEGDKTETVPAFYSHIDRVVHDMKSGGHPGYTKPEEFVRRIEDASNDYIKYDFQKPEVVTVIDKSPPTVSTRFVPIKENTIKSDPTTRMPSTRSINDPCDDEYDPKWDEDCLGDSWVVRSYYDSKAEACKAFWYGGCHTSSRNIWFDKETCRTACAHKFPTSTPMIGAHHLDQSSESTTENVAPTEPSSSSSSSSSSNTVIFVSRSAHLVPAVSKISNPIILKIKAHISSEHRFKVDLDQKLADIKRENKGREDLEYSKLVQHPVTVAADCLDTFNQSLSKPCGDGKSWSNRYYYDKDTRSCRMFWSNGCFSSSKNNFDNLETCQWKCEGRHPQPVGKSCLDKFDERYLEDCRHGEFTNRFYFDHDRKKCVAFHWGGCQSKSQNFFSDMSVCQDLCESPPRELTQACIQPFDKSYENSCSAEKPQQYYYFDISSGICKMFWFGNCKGENENIFSTLESCQWICERKREERKPAICADKFDQKYTESCGNSQWTEKWYFDQSSGDCTSFWWDGCTSSSQNIFPDEKSCTSNCKHPGFEISSKLATEDSKFRCLEPVEIGNCQETYPAFYYDRTSRSCRPFAYSGCGGNSNRFMTVSQCENLCFAFNSMNEAEVDCHLPMHIGYGKNENSCLPQAGFRFYYDRNYGKCSPMWYLGCGGNANNFYSYEICQRTCSQSNEPRELERKTRASSEGRPKFGIRKIRAKVQQL